MNINFRTYAPGQTAIKTNGQTCPAQMPPGPRACRRGGGRPLNHKIISAQIFLRFGYCLYIQAREAANHLFYLKTN